MPNQPAAPSEADALRPWAQAILRARIPAALKLLLLALLSALAMAHAPRDALRRPHKDWLLSLTADTTEDEDSAWDPYVLRRFLRLRARLGWLMRCDRAEGMALSGHRAPTLRPTQAARAPPRHPHARFHPESVAKTPRPAAMTHARSVGTYPNRPRIPATIAIVASIAGTSSALACDENFATTSCRARSMNKCCPFTPSPNSIGVASRVTYHLSR